MGKWHRAAVVLVAAIIAWLLLPEFKAFMGTALALILRLLVIATIIAVAWLFAPLVFWDAPKLFYRRFFAPYLRLRRMKRRREEKLLAEAAARPDSRRQ